VVAGSLPAIVVFAALLVEGHPTRLLARGPYSSNFYEVQARMLLAGRVDFPPEEAGIEGIVRDGRTYVYWGFTPAFLRLPVVAVTDRLDGRLMRPSLLAAFCTLLAATGWLLALARGREAPSRTECILAGAFVFLVGAGSPILVLSSRPVVYHEAELWGAALAMCAYAALIRSWDASSGGWLATTCALATLAFNARPSTGAGPVIALGFCLLAGILRREPLPKLATRALAVTIPAAVYAAINLARFDSLFGVPIDRQVFLDMDEHMRAALAATGGSLFSVRFVPTTVLQYLRPDAIVPSRLFPFLTFHRPIHVVGGVKFYSLVEASSLPTAAPLLCVLAVLGVPRLLGRDLSVGWRCAMGGALVATLPVFTTAAVSNRYLTDLLPALILPAALAVPRVAAWLGHRPARRAVAFAVLLVAGTWSLAANVALALETQRLLILPTPATRRDFVAMQHDLDAKLFGGPPHGVIETARLPDDAPVGTVAIIGDCEGIYWRSGRLWYALERASGPRLHRLAGRWTEGRTELARGADWTLHMTVQDGRARFEYAPEHGKPARSGWIPVAVGGPAEIELVADDATREVQVSVAEQRLLDLWIVDSGGPVTIASAWKEIPVRAPFCDRMRARLRGERAA
jgi:hypothetical protein